MEAVFWLGMAIAAATAISAAMTSREEQIRRRRLWFRRIRRLRRRLGFIRRRPRRSPTIDRGPGFPLVGHAPDCACRDDHTIHMWAIPNLYERRPEQ